MHSDCFFKRPSFFFLYQITTASLCSERKKSVCDRGTGYTVYGVVSSPSKKTWNQKCDHSTRKKRAALKVFMVTKGIYNHPSFIPKWIQSLKSFFLSSTVLTKRASMQATNHQKERDNRWTFEREPFIGRYAIKSIYLDDPPTTWSSSWNTRLYNYLLVCLSFSQNVEDR